MHLHKKIDVPDHINAEALEWFEKLVRERRGQVSAQHGGGYPDWCSRDGVAIRNALDDFAKDIGDALLLVAQRSSVSPTDKAS